MSIPVDDERVNLPLELLDYVLSLVPPSQLQHTTLALLSALQLPISLAALFRHLRLTRSGQSWQLAQLLHHPSHSDFRSSVRTVVVQAWRDDPQLLANLLGSFPRVTALAMTVGPLFAPEQLEELLERPKWRSAIEQLSFRFNPYVEERSYYTFLKGAYFDTTPLTIASWPADAASCLRRLSFIQDLPPNHGVAVKETPAFGLVELADELERISPTPQLRRNARTEGKMDFAQPIVFFKLVCFTTLSLSPAASHLTHLVLRLPRRNLLPALTTHPTPLATPFPSLTSLDLSTSHLLTDARLPLLLRLHPTLEHLILDRCTGLIGPREAEDQAALTLRWLGKCCGGIGASRAEEVLRAWRRLIRDRPTGVPAPGPPPEEEPKKKRAGRSGYGNMPRAKAAVVVPAKKVVWTTTASLLVKDVLVVPPPPRLWSLGLGLFDIDERTDVFWRTRFGEGYAEAIGKTGERIEEAIDRWEGWRASGKLVDGTRRMVTLRDGVPPNSPWVDWTYVEPDEVFASFCAERKLIQIDPAGASEVLAALRAHAAAFVLCTKADCSGEPGKPHLSLSNVSKEDVGEREKREKRLWEEEGRERMEWRKEASEHRVGCGHLEGRLAWNEED